MLLLRFVLINILQKSLIKTFQLNQANPPYLQSTINYVECFLGKQLEGEELYWWTQFSTAILFIKTMIERMEKTGRENGD